MALVLDNNTWGALTNSDLKLAALVLHEAALLDVCLDANMAAPFLGLDNTRTVPWIT